MNKTIETTFKKLLGKGRAFITPIGFTSDFLDLLVSPFVELKERIVNLKLTHFPTRLTIENNVINGEELFGIEETEGLTLSERAANVEGQWSIFGGSQNYKQLELILQKKGLPVRVIENIPKNYNLYGSRYIGNGLLKTDSGIKDPIIATNGKHSFIIQADDFVLSQDVLISMIETLVKNKPAQNGAYYIPRFLRKKEIHHVLTKKQMQTYLKSQYCDVRVQGKF